MKCLWCGLDTDTIKETFCLCCGKPFIPKHIGKTFLSFGCSLTKYCEHCQKQIDAVKWFGHHRKEPKPQDLEKEIRNLLK
jgi:hypothetical protein